MPKVSFVSCVYNRAEHLAASIGSMLNQDLDDFEVVVVDDGSTDDTAQVLSRFQDARLRVITQQNTGFTLALIRGVAAATGDYIAIVDGGDICSRNRLRVQAEYLDAHPAVGVLGSWVVLEEKRNHNVSVVRLQTGADPKQTLMERSIFWHSEVMFRKALYDRVGGYRPEFYYSQDNDLWLRMSEHCDLAIVPAVLHRIIKFENGISTTPEKLAMARTYRAMAVHCARERRAGRPDPISRFGRSALLLRPRSATLANRLAGDGIKNVLREHQAVGHWLLAFALDEKKTARTIALWLAGHIPGVHLMRRAVLKVKSRIPRAEVALHAS